MVGKQVLHYDGSAWSAIGTNPAVYAVSSIWAFGSRNVYAVGEQGTILHYPGRWLGDINCDGSVNVVDLLLLGDSWGKSAGQAGYEAGCDLNNDTHVNLADVALLARGCGQ